jgi:hypothetical protein
MQDSDFLAALRALREGGVEFAVVGGIAAVLNGAPVNTFDLDIETRRMQGGSCECSIPSTALIVPWIC